MNGKRRPHPVAQRQNRPEWKLLLLELQFGPATADDLAEAIGRHRETTKRYLKHMRRAQAIRVYGYERTRSVPNKVWCLWDGRPDKEFRRLSGAKRAQRIRDGEALSTPSFARYGPRAPRRAKPVDTMPSGMVY